MKNVIKCLNEYKVQTILAPLFKMLEAIFELLVPLVVTSLIDIGIRQQDKQYIWKMCVLLVTFAMVGFLLSVIAQYFSAKAAMGVGTTLRSQVFRKVQYLSFEQLDTVGTSTLINYIIGDINLVQTGVNLFLRLFLRAPFIVIGATVMAFRIDSKITIIFIISTILVITIIFMIIKKTIISYKKAQERLDALALLIRENYTGARLIRAFNRQTDEQEEFNENNQKYTKMQVLAGRISALMNPSTFVVMNAAIILILYVAGPSVGKGILTQGQVVALVNYLMQILLAIVILAALIIAVARAGASAIRLGSVLDMSLREEVAEQELGVEDESGICFKNVSFCYDKDSEAQVDDLTFSIPRKSTIGIIGGTGAGKSTLVNLIPRFYDASAGQVYIDGVNVQQMPTASLRSKIGLVPQDATLFKGTLRDNLRWGKEDATDEEMYKALEVAQATSIVEQNEDGLDMKIEQGGRNVSGGQRQRLSIARAIIGRPEILILDDSGSALDYITEAKMRKELREYTKENIVVIVSQRVSSIQETDNILVLDDGKLVGEGTHQELLKSNEVYREIYESQSNSTTKRREK